MPCNSVKQLVDIVYPVWNDAFIYLFFHFFSIGLVSWFLKNIPRSDTDATSLFQQWSSVTGWFFQYARRDSYSQLNFKRKKKKVKFTSSLWHSGVPCCVNGVPGFKSEKRYFIAIYMTKDVLAYLKGHNRNIWLTLHLGCLGKFFGILFLNFSWA